MKKFTLFLICILLAFSVCSCTKDKEEKIEATVEGVTLPDIPVDKNDNHRPKEENETVSDDSAVSSGDNKSEQTQNTPSKQQNAEGESGKTEPSKPSQDAATKPSENKPSKPSENKPSDSSGQMGGIELPDFEF